MWKVIIYFSMILIVFYVSINKHLAFRHTKHVQEIMIMNNENLSFKRIEYYLDQQKNLYFSNNKKKFNVLVMGDSHAIDILNSLKQFEINEPKNFQIKFQFLHQNCLLEFIENKSLIINGVYIEKDKICKEQLSLLLKSQNFKKSNIIIYSVNWTVFLPDHILKFNDYVRAFNKKIIFLGPNARFVKRPDEIIFRTNSIEESNKIAFNKLDNDTILIDNKFKKFSELHNIAYLSKLDQICTSLKKECQLILNTKVKSYMDTNHWTMEGAKLFGNKIFTDDLSELLNKFK
jgi:hypothetical protein